MLQNSNIARNYGFTLPVSQLDERLEFTKTELIDACQSIMSTSENICELRLTIAIEMDDPLPNLNADCKLSTDTVMYLTNGWIIDNKKSFAQHKGLEDLMYVLHIDK